MTDTHQWTDPICDMARTAGRAIMTYYGTDAGARAKADASPVTDADEAANTLIVKALKQLTPDIPIIAEESVAKGDIPEIGGGRFWLVDPLDGTKEFIQGRDEFTVNIALIADGAPVLGVVGLPAQDRLYWGGVDLGAWQIDGTSAPEPIAVRSQPDIGATVVASRSHFTAETEEWLQDVTIANLHRAGSSNKFCVIASGDADLYPRLGRTMEWDIAAGDAILRAAGGRVTLLDGTPMTYGKPNFENPYFVACGS